MNGIFPILAGILMLLAGCCSSTTPSSSSGCTTYGEACTNICANNNLGEGCFTQCMDGVRSEGLGDATTCCKSTFGQYCDQTCSDLEASTEGDTTKAECMEECTATIAVSGAPLESCYLPI